MTNEQAKKILIDYVRWFKDDQDYDIPDVLKFPKAIDCAIQALTDQSTPTDTARAEDVLKEVAHKYIESEYPKMDVEFMLKRFLTDYFINNIVIPSMTAYAAPIRAEVERVRWEKELVMRQLSAANQRIAEMEKQIESNKKALASNGTISGTGTARFSARTNSLRSMYSKRLPGIGK